MVNRLVYNVEGITNKTDVNQITDSVMELTGIEYVKASYRDKTVEVGGLDLDDLQIRDKIEEMGYTVL